MTCDKFRLLCKAIIRQRKHMNSTQYFFNIDVGKMHTSTAGPG